MPGDLWVASDGAIDRKAGMRERVRRASSAFDRGHRKRRARRSLFARLPHLRAVGPGNGFAARPNLLDEDGERGQCGDKFDLGEPLRQLSRLHGLHDGVPFGGRLRETDRGYPRPDRTKNRTLPSRKTPPAIYFRGIYAPGSLAPNAAARACLSKIPIAGRRAQLVFAQVLSK